MRRLKKLKNAYSPNMVSHENDLSHCEGEVDDEMKKRNASNTLFWALSLALTLLLGEINVGPTLWKWNSHMMVGHTMILPNKRVSARESAQKRVLLAFLNEETWDFSWKENMLWQNEYSSKSHVE